MENFTSHGLRDTRDTRDTDAPPQDASLDEDLEHEDLRAFDAGRVFERHRKASGLSQEAFLQVLFDLHADRRAAFKNRGSTDFVAGRLFERFGARSVHRASDVVTPAQFKHMISLVGDQIDVFDAGRTFERFADPGLGAVLSPAAFVRLCRSTRLGDILLGWLRAETDEDLEGTRKFERSNPETLSNAHISHHSPSAPLRKGSRHPPSRGATRDSETYFYQDNDDGDEDTRNERIYPRTTEDENDDDVDDDDDRDRQEENYDPSSILRRIKLAVTKMTKAEDQIAALEAEMHAEARLRHELPEAYSEVKERMLNKYIQTLQDKRAVHIDSVKRLQRLARPKPQSQLSKTLAAHRRRRRHMPSPYPDFPLAAYELEDGY
ncbi:Hypothetical Protein FCC1311_092312 [Hondaea fermentalgiana]|uniref:Uncharacterized protein n=1 Tax=Hondaea fermentalgiana TaxID=2315210 RepID=A0A2R5GQ66_9STRA|nr:Hypothetical Protein FCC1311_092312 [Hondaea fermentalgiana]|eukprot:GBG33007.1 Hypothetical Protein FCC1311_092312 [Hondaea fermentalgiana]